MRISTGSLMVEQGIDGVAGGVLEPVLVADLGGKLGVRQHLGAQGGEPREQLWAPGRKGGAAVGIAAVQHGAIGQQQGHGVQGVMLLWAVPQHMPLALLAAMPPSLQALMEAGSGPILRPRGAR